MDVGGGGRTIETAMTAKEKLRHVVDDLSEAEAADVLELLSGSRVLDGEALTQILDGIPGAYESAQRGLQQAREGRTTSLDDLRASR
jgi:hypothetical protein